MHIQTTNNNHQEMKQLAITLSLLFAVVCSHGVSQAAALVSPQDTINRYIIDNKTVEHFDGSQLEGKKIVTYNLSTSDSSNETIKIHYIRTDSAVKAVDPVFIIDGKQVTKKKFEKLNPSEIKSITILKKDSPEAKQYSGSENGVILVETRSNDEIKDPRINIGYGMTDRHDLTYSVNSVKPEETEFYTSMYEYLRGRVPGVQVAPDNTIYIRGINTLKASSEPLILVDGVEIKDLSIINPQDVYSVDVLKDSATSIYGLRGANGVILITTKRGKDAKK